MEFGMTRKPYLFYQQVILEILFRNCRYSATTTELTNFPLRLRIIPVLNLSVAEHLVIENLFPC